MLQSVLSDSITYKELVDSTYDSACTILDHNIARKDVDHVVYSHIETLQEYDNVEKIYMGRAWSENTLIPCDVAKQVEYSALKELCDCD